MNDVCRTGFREIQQLEQEQQARLDSALIRSMQPDREAGMQGEPLPYLLRSDWLVTLCLFLCFLLYSYALRNGKKYLAQRFRTSSSTNNEAACLTNRSVPKSGTLSRWEE